MYEKWLGGRMIFCGNMRKKLGMLAMNMRVRAVSENKDGNCENSEPKR
jgi:hypothetical protein